MASAYLIIRAAKKNKKMKVADEPITIGRHPDNVLAVKDDRMSRRHCVIERANGGVQVTDLGSSNGTRINGEKIHGATPLRPGDVLKVGGLRIELAAPSQRTETTAREPVEAGGRARPSRRAASPGAAPPPDDPLDPDEAVEPLEFEEESDDLQPDIGDRRGFQFAPSAGDEDGLPSADGASDHERKLRAMVESLPDKSFDETAVRLINARGQRAAAPEETRTKKKKKGDDSDSKDGIRLLRLLLLLCARTAASDIHVEPRDNRYLARIRVDGVMVEVAKLPQAVGTKLMGVVKILAELDIAQKTAVQDGHFTSEVPGRRIDYRVSFTPVVQGQKLVIRALDLATTPKHLGDLQLPGWMLDQISQLIKQDSGMLLCCGPTGSGKTTSLYAGIRGINVDQRNVITIEDPPEYQIEGVTQTPINEQQGNTFSSLLRSILRQDPDVILIGEIRDGETARIALQAAMTGHLVLSTVHARDTIGTIFRLLDLGAEPYLVASALNLVLAQRLIRRLCDHCKTPARPKPGQMVKMGRAGEGLQRIYYPVGCPRCLETGYSGRLGMYELLSVNEDIRDVILENPNMQDLRKAMDMTLFNSLKQSGYKLVAEGKTAITEIDRVVGAD